MPQIALDSPVRFLSGVGPARAEQLARLGIRTVEQLLEHYPLRHGYQGPSQPIDQLRPGASATVIGQIVGLQSRGRHARPSILAMLVDGSGACYVRWFNARFLQTRLAEGQWLRVHGTVGRYNGLAQFINPRFEVLDSPESADRSGRFEPVYPATAALPSRQIARLVRTALAVALPQLQEWYPPRLRQLRNLPTRQAAIACMHRPADHQQIEPARRRLAYDELLLLQLAIALRRQHVRSTARAHRLPVDQRLDARIRRRLPFVLTDAQNRVISQIVADLARDRPMNRLLQGDVGSGKTAVAVYAALAAVANRCQVAIMAPTEILAEQHHRKFSHYLRGSRVRIALLRGQLPARRRAELLRQIAAGRIDLVIGTHALIQGDVRFARLGLVVVDEQHRFGVLQRALIRSKGLWPHYLVMTATPIPRTLALTIFGELDISVIDELPPGRGHVQTRIIAPGQLNQAWQFVRQRLARGQQAYVVYPLLQESDALPLKAAAAEAERLARDVFAGWQVGLLHGQMSPAQKQRVMGDFVAGRIHVLVTTTVVEVGIDVPNATVMLIQHADRYGLSQLHQLRGRIGRGRSDSCCLLLSASNSAAAGSRLAALASSNDGFYIAEQDLRLRGPGQIAGLRQHGLPELKVADLLRDADLLAAARQDAAQIVADDPRLSRLEHAALRQALIRRMGEKIPLIDVA